MGIVNLNKGINMLLNDWHINESNSNLVVVRTVKEPFLFKLFKELSLLLSLASSKEVPLRFNPLVCCRRSINICLIKWEIWLLISAKANLALCYKICFPSLVRTNSLWKTMLSDSLKEVFHSTNSCSINY